MNVYLEHQAAEAALAGMLASDDIDPYLVVAIEAHLDDEEFDEACELAEANGHGALSAAIRTSVAAYRATIAFDAEIAASYQEGLE